MLIKQMSLGPDEKAKNYPSIYLEMRCGPGSWHSGPRVAELQRLRGPRSSSVTECRRLRERAANKLYHFHYSCLSVIHVFKKSNSYFF